MADMINKMTFNKIHLRFDGVDVLRQCDFDFPLNCNSRFVFSSDREKFYFFHSLSQIDGFINGQYMINDENALQMSFEEFLKYRLKIGFAFSTRGLLQNRTLKQNLLLPLEFHNVFSIAEREQWLDHCMGYFDIRDDLDKRPSDVSPSSQKATLILRAFIHQPELIIMDTPDLMLSKRHQANLLQLIADHRKHYKLRHLMFSTNDEDLSDCLADKYILLRKKKLQLIESTLMQRGAA
jgi:phospholipid/cholesterol/gamma-HCH transport system ATP-binding protein